MLVLGVVVARTCLIVLLLARCGAQHVTNEALLYYIILVHALDILWQLKWLLTSYLILGRRLLLQCGPRSTDREVERVSQRISVSSSIWARASRQALLVAKEVSILAASHGRRSCRASH